MQIIGAQEFLKLPANTLYSKYKSGVFGELHIKGETCFDSFDFSTQSISDSIECTDSSDFMDKLQDAENNGTMLKFDFECCGRDGLFNKEQLYAVWDNDDVQALIKRLGLCTHPNQ